jgi:hypothetical protein
MYRSLANHRQADISYEDKIRFADRITIEPMHCFHCRQELKFPVPPQLITHTVPGYLCGKEPFHARRKEREGHSARIASTPEKLGTERSRTAAVIPPWHTAHGTLRLVCHHGNLA